MATEAARGTALRIEEEWRWSACGVNKSIATSVTANHDISRAALGAGKLNGAGWVSCGAPGSMQHWHPAPQTQVFPDAGEGDKQLPIPRGDHAPAASNRHMAHATRILAIAFTQRWIPCVGKLFGFLLLRRFELFHVLGGFLFKAFFATLATQFNFLPFIN